MIWRSDEIVQATKGILHGASFEALSVAIDSRKAQPGTLFIALRGERVDGHDYVKDALAHGASAALVERIPQGLAPNASFILVQDVMKALTDLARASRARTSAKIIAVTGSVGKTGTKEAIHIALASAGNVYATKGNLNNHIGLPLSLANLPRDARFGVFELGMNHAGEISFLTRLLRPEIAVITNIEAVHLEFFANLEAIADAKAEILEGMTVDGTLILNRDNRFFDYLQERAKARGIKHVATFGMHEDAQCRLLNYEIRDMGSQLEAMIHGTPVTYRLGAIGRHYALASLAALAAAVGSGADLADAAAALAHFHEPDGRGRLHRVTLAQGAITLIDDCYNASPTSVNASIDKLAEIHAALAEGGRKIVMLGDMLELGGGAVGLHKDLLASLTRNRIDKVCAVGPLMKHLYDILPSHMQGIYKSTAADLAAATDAMLRAGDVVLIKGSRGSRMDIVRDALVASSHRRESADAV